MVEIKREIMSAHVRHLCDRHGICIVERKCYGGSAWKRARTIAIKPVKTERTYIVALHEIGHIVGPGRSGVRLEQEVAAWRFAISQSIVPLSAASYRRMLVYLDSYLSKAARSRRMTVPDPQHEFWRTYRLIQIEARG